MAFKPEDFSNFYLNIVALKDLSFKAAVKKEVKQILTILQ